MLLSIYGSALQHLQYLHSIGLGKSFDDLNKIKKYLYILLSSNI